MLRVPCCVRRVACSASPPSTARKASTKDRDHCRKNAGRPLRASMQSEQGSEQGTKGTSHEAAQRREPRPRVRRALRVLHAFRVMARAEGSARARAAAPVSAPRCSRAVRAESGGGAALRLGVSGRRGIPAGAGSILRWRTAPPFRVVSQRSIRRAARGARRRRCECSARHRPRCPGVQRAPPSPGDRAARRTGVSFHRGPPAPLPRDDPVVRDAPGRLRRQVMNHRTYPESVIPGDYT